MKFEIRFQPHLITISGLVPEIMAMLSVSFDHQMDLEALSHSLESLT